MKNYINVLKKDERIFVDIVDLKLICGDWIIRSHNNSNFNCILDLLDSINSSARTEDLNEVQEVVNAVIAHFESVDKDGSDNMLVQLYPGYFGSPKEILKGLESMTINDVIKHYNDMINSASSNYVVTAPFDKNPNLKNVALSNVSTSPVKYKNYSPKLSNVYKPNKTSRVVVDTAELNQAQIYKTYSFKMSGNIKDEVKFELLNEILGGSPASRLFQELRDS